MRTIYIDSDFKCYATDDGTRTAVETDFFDDKCDAFVEGYRYIPEGFTWTREDGETFTGEMVAPWRNYAELESLQRQYEALNKELEAVLDLLTSGVTA